jgi:hypothetical protein
MEAVGISEQLVDMIVPDQLELLLNTGKIDETGDGGHSHAISTKLQL